MTHVPDVSIVVCTYNRASLLGPALASLQRQRTAGEFSYEIVVVDNGSTDATPQVARHAAAASQVPLRYFFEPRPGVACARNRGVREAAGSWIAFFDDDQLAEPDWLAELLRFAEQRGLACAGGAVHLSLPRPKAARRLGPTCRMLLGESGRHDSPRPYTRRRPPGTGNMLLRKEVFDRVGGFDETLAAAGEDSDLWRRMRAGGMAAWCTPRAVVWHIIPPYRLQSDYLTWAARRVGTHIAQRERQDLGRVRFVVVWLARAVQAAWHAAADGWRLWRHRDARSLLEARCRRGLAEGYLRRGLALMAPRLFSQENFFAGLEFRSERHTLVGQRG